MKRCLQFRIPAPVDYKYLKMAKGFGTLQDLFRGKTAILPSACFQIFIIGLDLLHLGNVNNKTAKLLFVRKGFSDPLLTGINIIPLNNHRGNVCAIGITWVPH